jgi:hypothetical protein
MEIKIDSAVLCKGDQQSTAGDPVGPDNYRFRLMRGVDAFEYIGEAGIASEHKGADRVNISFSVARTYSSNANALSAIATIKGLDMEGAVTVDSGALMTKGNVLTLEIQHIGCTLICTYVIEGY